MIVRNPNKKRFTKVDWSLARSGTLRPDELGLYTLMLSHSDNWDFSEKALIRETDATPEELRDILHRLEKKGFTERRKNRFGTVWDLIEDPQSPEEVDRVRRILSEEEAEKRGDGIDIIKSESGNASPQDPENEPKPEAPTPAAPQMTNEEMAQSFFALAEKLRKKNMENRIKREQACRNGQNGV